MSALQLQMRRPHMNDLPAMPALPDGLALVECKASDAVGLARLLTASFHDPTWTVTRVREALLDAPDVLTTFAVKAGRTIIATASVRDVPDRFPGAGYVHWVAAAPSRSGQRLGYFISLAVLHRFAANGCADAYLETDDARLPAIKTYLNLGFEPVMRDDTHPARWAAIMGHLS